MKMDPRSSIRGVMAAVVALGLSAGHAAESANEFPSKPVRIVVPFQPGGTADLLPRAIAEKLAAAWKQPVIVDNRAGAGGNIGAQVAATSAADGYTLLASPPGPLAINQSIYQSLPFSPAALTPVSIFATVPIVLAVRTTLPVSNVQELISLVKASPGKFSYASAGSGSTPHLAGSMFATTAKLDLVHVPYKGTSQSMNDLMGGQVDMFFDNLTAAQDFHLGGKIKILAIASPKRSPNLPDVPTMAEAGLPAFQLSTWYAAALPTGTPPDIVAKWNKALNAALMSPDIQQRLRTWGAETVGGTPAQAISFVKSETVKWKKLAADANAVVN